MNCYSLLVGALLDEMHVQNPHPTVVFDAGMQYVCFFVGNDKYLRYPWKLAAGTWKSSQDEVWIGWEWSSKPPLPFWVPVLPYHCHSHPQQNDTKCPSSFDKPATCPKKQVPREIMQNPLATVLNVLEKMVDHGISEKIGYQMIQRCTSRLVADHRNDWIDSNVSSAFQVTQLQRRVKHHCCPGSGRVSGDDDDGYGIWLLLNLSLLLFSSCLKFMLFRLGGTRISRQPGVYYINGVLKSLRILKGVVVDARPWEWKVKINRDPLLHR